MIYANVLLCSLSLKAGARPFFVATYCELRGLGILGFTNLKITVLTPTEVALHPAGNHPHRPIHYRRSGTV
jgi:hypothetical protein